MIIGIALAIASYYLGIYLLRNATQATGNRAGHHQDKSKTPTMGGIVIVLGALIQFYGVSALSHPISLCLIGFAGLGLIDDVVKIKAKMKAVPLQDCGMRAKYKFILQWGYAFFVLSLMTLDPVVNVLGYSLSLGKFYVIFAAFLIVATSNAYNLTDGVDGLAASQAILLLAGGAYLAWMKQEMLVFQMILMMETMLIGFLWVNKHPAKLFMGDVGSLSIGAVIGLLAVMLKVEILLGIAGFVLVFETLSVILQVSFYKMGYGRIFKMAPFHHHLELSGFSENQVVLFSSSLTLILMLLSSYAI